MSKELIEYKINTMQDILSKLVEHVDAIGKITSKMIDRMDVLEKDLSDRDFKRKINSIITAYLPYFLFVLVVTIVTVHSNIPEQIKEILPVITKMIL